MGERGENGVRAGENRVRIPTHGESLPLSLYPVRDDKYQPYILGNARTSNLVLATSSIAPTLCLLTRSGNTGYWAELHGAIPNGRV